jgi:hypothetical protein
VAFLNTLCSVGLSEVRVYQDLIHTLRPHVGYDSNKFTLSDRSTVQRAKDLTDRLACCFYCGDEKHPNSAMFYQHKLKNRERCEFRFNGSSSNIPDAKQLRDIAKHFKGQFLISFLHHGAELQIVPIQFLDAKCQFFREYEAIRHLLQQRNSSVLSKPQVSLLNDFLVRGLILAGYCDQDLMKRRKEERLRGLALPKLGIKCCPLSLLMIRTNLETAEGGLGSLSIADVDYVIHRFSEDFTLTDPQKTHLFHSNINTPKYRLKALITSTLSMLEAKPEIMTLRGLDGVVLFKFVQQFRNAPLNVENLKEESCNFERRLPCNYKAFEDADLSDERVRDSLVVVYANFHALMFSVISQHMIFVVKRGVTSVEMHSQLPLFGNSSPNKMTLVMKVSASVLSLWNSKFRAFVTRQNFPSHTAQAKDDRTFTSDADGWIMTTLHSLIKPKFKLRPCLGSCSFCQNIAHTNTLIGESLDVYKDLRQLLGLEGTP